MSARFAKFGEKAGRFVAVATAYALSYYAVLYVSDGLWALTAGLRLACLFLVPARYWPALLVGECVPMVGTVSAYAPHIGIIAARLSSVPPILFVMPIAWWCRYRLALFPARGLINFTVLMLCIVACSLTWAAASYGIMGTVVVPAKSPAFHRTAAQFWALAVGQYAGALTLVPIALLIRMQNASYTMRERFHRWAASPLTFDIVAILLPTLIVLTLLLDESDKQYSALFRMAIFIMVLMLTVKHGWTAACIGCMAAIGALSINMISVAATNVIAIQAFTGFSLTCVLLVGANISARRLSTKTLLRRAGGAEPDLQETLTYGLRDVLEFAYVGYRYASSKTKLSDLSADSGTALSRIVLESIDHLMRYKSASRIETRVRRGVTNGTPWIFLRIEGSNALNDLKQPIVKELTGFGLQEHALHALAHENQCKLRVRKNRSSAQIDVMMKLSASPTGLQMHPHFTGRGLLVS